VLDLNHDFMLKQMAGSKLDMSNLMAPTDPGSTPPLPPAPPSVRNATAQSAPGQSATAPT
jgi:hypothetical protein